MNSSLPSAAPRRSAAFDDLMFLPVGGNGCTIRVFAVGTSHRLIGEPLAIRREHGVGGNQALDITDRRRLSIAQGERPQRVIGILDDIHQDRLTVGRRCFRDVYHPRLGLRQALDGPALRRLPVQSAVAVAVGLKDNAAAVSGPDRKPVAAAECDASSRRGARQIVNPDNRLLALIGCEGQTVFRPVKSSDMCTRRRAA